jgi:hypothetical protein
LDSYPQRIVAHQPHSEVLAGEQLVGRKRCLFFWFVKVGRLLEEAQALLIGI